MILQSLRDFDEQIDAGTFDRTAFRKEIAERMAAALKNPR
jgi:hypothetical protein